MKEIFQLLQQATIPDLQNHGSLGSRKSESFQGPTLNRYRQDNCEVAIQDYLEDDKGHKNQKEPANCKQSIFVKDSPVS